MWTLQRLCDSRAELTGIRASYETVRLVLKAGKMVLSRPQHLEVCARLDIFVPHTAVEALAVETPVQG